MMKIRPSSIQDRSAYRLMWASDASASSPARRIWFANAVIPSGSTKNPLTAGPNRPSNYPREYARSHDPRSGRPCPPRPPAGDSTVDLPRELREPVEPALGNGVQTLGLQPVDAF